jgi:type IV secretory pathway VirB2 component (pilin)
MIVAATVLGCVGYGAYLMSGTISGPVVLTVVALVVAAAAAAQVLLPASGKAGHLTAVAFAGAAVLLLSAAASVNSVIGGLGPFDTPFESPGIAHDNQLLAANAPALTRAVQRLELQTPPGDALFGTDTSGLASNYILYSGREVLPIRGFLGNVSAPALATLQADISRGYVRPFVLPVSPPGPGPRVRWIESHCTRQPPPPNRRPVPHANFFCGGPAPAGRLPQPPEHRPAAELDDLQAADVTEHAQPLLGHVDDAPGDVPAAQARYAYASAYSLFARAHSSRLAAVSSPQLRRQSSRTAQSGASATPQHGMPS